MPIVSSSALFPLWFLLFFIALWLGVTTLLAYMAGWPALAAQFRCDEIREGNHFRFASGAIGESIRFPVNYRNCLFLTVTETGLQLSILFLFRVFSPPLFIPWKQIESVTRDRVWFLNIIVLRIRGRSTKIMLRGAVAESVMTAYEKYASGINARRV